MTELQCGQFGFMGRSFHGELMRVESASYLIGMARQFSGVSHG